jgi:hypothetical protein
MNITWEYLATVAGAGAVVTVIVQFIKKIIGHDLNKWYLRLITYITALALLDVALIFIGWDWSSFALNFVNAVLVYLAATGEYHTVVKELTKQ